MSDLKSQDDLPGVAPISATPPTLPLDEEVIKKPPRIARKKKAVSKDPFDQVISQTKRVKEFERTLRKVSRPYKKKASSASLESIRSSLFDILEVFPSCSHCNRHLIARVCQTCGSTMDELAVERHLEFTPNSDMSRFTSTSLDQLGSTDIQDTLFSWLTSSQVLAMRSVHLT